MKENLFLQIRGEEINLNTFTKEARQVWKSNGKPLKAIEKVDFYIKPEEKKCYFVINDDFKGHIDYSSGEPKALKHALV